MATFQRVIESIKDTKQALQKRLELIREIEELTGRPLLIYVADFNNPDSALKAEDKTGFSDLIENVDQDEVDFLIHSPGGFAEVAEAIVGMLRGRFTHIRFAIPNMAKSAATLLVLSGDELLMDHRSELGPVDPQVEVYIEGRRRREAAEDIIQGFEEAKKVLSQQGLAVIPAYVPLLRKYTIGLLQACRNASNLSQTLAEDWLRQYMFAGDPDSTRPKTISEFFAKRVNTLSHRRPIRIEKCLELGLKVIDLREGQHKALADKLWELWCLYELHFERTPVNRMYENSRGCTLQKQSVRVQLVAKPGAIPGEP